MNISKTQFLQKFMEQIWNQKKVEVIGKYVHPAYTVHLDTADPWEGKTLSHQEFEERLQYSFKSFPDMHFDIQSAIEDEHHVAITWIMTGTNLGNIGDFPTTNKSIKTTGITIYHFKDDKISGHTQVFDRAKVARQLFPMS